jgi:RNA-dependent RNA polymerase
LCKVYRLVCTPTRFIYLPPLLAKGSRLYRKFGSERFVSVSFRDEQQQKLHGDDLLRFVEQRICEGLTAAGRSYAFFSASGSQLREQQLLFIDEATLCASAPGKTSNIAERLESMRASIVPPRHNEPSVVSRFLSRIALWCTSDTPTEVVNEQNVAITPDTLCQDGALLSDGAGAISQTLAKRICTNYLELEHTPSALQIRWRGVKGVVTVVPDDSPLLRRCNSGMEDDQALMMVRKSMIKMQTGSADDSTLCVVSYAKRFPLHLNREIITLLTSIELMGRDANSNASFDPTAALMQKMETVLQDEANMFVDTGCASRELQAALPYTLWRYFEVAKKHNVDVLQDPFWVSILQTRYRFKLQSLVEKTRIPVADGALLLGIPDPLGILQEGEIFVHLESTTAEGEFRVLRETNVAIWRNPCLHPGDVRVVTAVDYPQLHQWKNVVIFPCKDGLVKNMALSCSGGDLDGDHFYVMWDSELVPPRSAVVAPLKYQDLSDITDVSGQSPFHQSRQTYFDNTKVSSFVRKVFGNDFLGRIAHMHLAFSDQSNQGARDPLACELAAAHSYAVDFPKNGISPVVPQKIRETLSKTGYPDFMDNRARCSYSSNKALGHLYRRASEFEFKFESVSQIGRSNENKRWDAVGCGVVGGMPLDQRLLLQDRERFAESAKPAYLAYSSSLRALMLHYGLKTDGECVLGRALHWHPLVNDKGKAAGSVRAAFELLQTKHTEIFLQLHGAKPVEEQRKAASAWYDIAYRNGHARSFCLVVHQFFPEMWAANPRANTGGRHAQIGMQAIRHYRHEKEHSVNSAQIKMSVLATIRDKFQSAGLPSPRVFGSVAQGLCKIDSDLDLFIPLDSLRDAPGLEELSGRDLQQQFLQLYVSPALEEFCDTKQVILEARVPIVRCSLPSPRNADADLVKVDFCCSPAGLSKAEHMQHLFLADPAFYCAFGVLQEWSRVAGLVGTKTQSVTSPAGPSLGVLASGDFHALVLSVLEKEIAKSIESSVLSSRSNTHQNDERGEFWSRVVMNRDSCHDSRAQLSFVRDANAARVGLYLLTFFEGVQLACIDDIVFAWSKDAESCGPSLSPPAIATDMCVTIPSSIIKEVARFSEPARHCLVLGNSIRSLLELAAGDSRKSRLTKKLPLGLSYRVGSAYCFHADRLALLSGCSVKIERIEGKANLLLTATGSHVSILKLKRELASAWNHASAWNGRTRRNTSKYFMENSSELCVLGATLPDVELKFQHLLCTKPGSQSISANKDSFAANLGNNANEQSVCRVVNPGHLHLNHTTGISEDQVVVQRMADILRRQTAKMPATSEMQSIQFDLRLGHFVVVNISRTLPDSQRTLSAKQILEGMEKSGRQRKRWNRGDPSERIAESSSNTPTQALEPSKVAGAGQTRRAKKKQHAPRQKKTPGIWSTFIPTFRGRARDLETKFGQALLQCGFIGFKPDSDAEDVGIHLNADFFVNTVLSQGYEVRAWYKLEGGRMVDSNDKLRSVDLSERQLNWVQCTVLGNGNMPDLRTRVRTTAPISQRLRDLAIAHCDCSPVIWQSASSGSHDHMAGEGSLDVASPVFRDDVSDEQRRKVSYIRHTVRQRTYKSDVLLPGGGRELVEVEAHVTTARQYHNFDHRNRLSEACETCELTLQFRSDLLFRPDVNFEHLASMVLSQGAAIGAQLKHLELSLD